MRGLANALPVLAALFLCGAGCTLRGCSSGDPSWSDPEETDGLTASLGEYFARVHGFTLDDVHWGDLHGHSRYSYDAPPADTPEEALQYAKDPLRGDLDFVCLSEHAEMPPANQCPAEDADLWQSLRRLSREYSNENPAAGRPFVVFPGWEYTNTRGLAPLFGSEAGYGHKVVLFKGFDLLPPTRTAAWGIKGSGTGRIAGTARELWQDLDAWRPLFVGTEGTVLTIPHTTSMKGIAPPQDHRTDWDAMDPDFVRPVEIISKWGNTEGPPPAEAACVLDDTSSLVDYDAGEQDTRITIRALLYRKWVVEGDPCFRLAFVGGTDNHTGQPGNWEERQWGTDLALEHRGGVTGIVAAEITRDALWSGLWAGRTLASHSGPHRPRVLVAVHTGGRHVMMGGHAAHDGSARLRVLGGEEVQRLEVVLDGCLYESVESAVLDRTIPLAPGRHYLYVRAGRQDGEFRSFAWSSPVYLE